MAKKKYAQASGGVASSAQARHRNRGIERGVSAKRRHGGVNGASAIAAAMYPACMAGAAAQAAAAKMKIVSTMAYRVAAAA